MNRESRRTRRGWFLNIPAALLYLLLYTGSVAAPRAEVFPLPPDGGDLIGAMNRVTASAEDTLIDIARRTNLGYDEIRAANPSVDPWLPKADTPVVIPNYFLLPPGPREGIVVNVAEMRLYYFPEPASGQAATVETFPVSVGRGDWSTPVVTTRITAKVADPVWYPPESIRKEHAADGTPLPKVVAAGPDNPLGRYALRMSLPSYLIHGTNREYGIGMQVTHGCLRLYPEDIERLYRRVPVGTQVRIVNEPYKAGWHQGTLYLEVHPLLEGAPTELRRNKTPLIEAIVAATHDRPDYPVDWNRVRQVEREETGLPVAVGPAVKMD